MTDPLTVLGLGAVAVLGRQLTDLERHLFSKYLTLLIKWQKTHRFVGSADPAWIVGHLFVDSLLFLKLLPREMSSMLDLGSGAGVPGIPIKIVKPGVQLVLVESRQRRASFLSSVVRELGFEQTRVISGRVQEFMGELTGRFDAVVMRCAGNLEELFPLAAQLVAPGGIVAASGPPRPTPLRLGEWVTVAAARPGRTRRFAVYRSD